MTSIGDTLWPLDGLRWLLMHPALWWRPLAAHAVALLVLLLVGSGCSWWLWPEPQPWYWHTLKALGAVALGMLVAISAWMLTVPVLLALVLDSLASAVFRERGLPEAPVALHRSLAAGIAVVIRTLPLRLRWLMVALLGLFTGPAAPFALGVRGLDSAQRMARYADERNALRGAAMTAGALQLGLAFTFVGWLLWLPSLVCGAALLTAEREGHRRA